MTKDCFGAEGEVVNRSTEFSLKEMWEAVPKPQNLELLILSAINKYADRALKRDTWVL